MKSSDIWRILSEYSSKMEGLKMDIYGMADMLIFRGIAYGWYVLALEELVQSQEIET